MSLTVGDLQLRVERTAEGCTVDGRARPDLAVSDSAEIVVAYTDLPAGTVTTDPQRYTRRSEDEYLYESMDSDLARPITVDGAGLAVGSPDVFVRENTPPNG